MWLRGIAVLCGFVLLLSLPACFGSQPREPAPDRPTRPPIVKWPVEPPQDGD